ncbi:MAG: sensor histidine kinase [Anaerolineales bacterium]
MKALSDLADSGLPQECAETAQTVIQKTDLLSHQILAQRESLERDAQQARQERNEFISVVTHELRLPMTSIKGYTDLLRQGVVGHVNEQQLGFLDTIRSNVDRMAALLSDLSDISRIDTGRLKLEISVVDIEQPLDVALQALRPTWEMKRQTVEINLASDIKPVTADRNRLTQLITNLLRNAVMYTPDGGAIIIRAFQEGRYLHFEIADNGIGIKAEDQVRLFSPFFRSDEAYVRDQPGWGISLHLSSKLVQVMHGSIGMYSKPEKGSVFWITLPLQAS